MLKPAILYSEEIEKKSLGSMYSQEYFYYVGGLFHGPIHLRKEDDGGNHFEYAIVNKKDELLGYFAYMIDYFCSVAYNFGLYSFDPGNVIIGIDIMKEITSLINDYHINKIEFRCIEGNPVERHYDSFCKKFNGNKITVRQIARDQFGFYHDEFIYEIFPNGYTEHPKRKIKVDPNAPYLKQLYPYK